MSLRVFLFAKKMKFLTKGGIHCISQVFSWHFCFMLEHSLAELTEHDDSAANIMVHRMYTYMYFCMGAPVAQRHHVTSDTLGREFDPGKRDFSHCKTKK